MIWILQTFFMCLSQQFSYLLYFVLTKHFASKHFHCGMLIICQQRNNSGYCDIFKYKKEHMYLKLIVNKYKKKMVLCSGICTTSIISLKPLYDCGFVLGSVKKLSISIINFTAFHFIFLFNLPWNPYQYSNPISNIITISNIK